MGPGSRWWMPGIALNTCVTSVAPASKAARATCSSASVCPIATTTPAAAKRRTASSAPGSSGAMVIWLMRPAPAASRRSIVSASGSWRNSGAWAPRRPMARNGPSRCAPTTVGSLAASSATVESDASTSSSGLATSEMTDRVVPCARCTASAAAISSAPLSKAAPPPPWPCRSMKPGVTVRPCRSSTVAAGGGASTPASPIAAMRSPSISTQPSRRPSASSRLALRSSVDTIGL